jgi:hypothetical protein
VIGHGEANFVKGRSVLSASMTDDVSLVFMNDAIIAGRLASRSKNFIAGSRF